MESSNARTMKRRVASARDLRKRQTPAETLLWEALRGDELGHRIRRQHGIGPFVVDFCCVPARLVIEVDGDIHDLPDVAEQDQWRSEYLIARGFSDIRFSNEQILSELDQVLAAISTELSKR